MGGDRLDREAAIGLARQFLDAMSAMDYDAVAALMAADVIVEFPNGRKPTRSTGRDPLIAGFKRDLPGFIRRIAFIIERETFDEAAQRVVLEYRSEGERVDGRPYRNRYIGCWDFDGGAIIQWREYYNPSKLA